MCFTSQNVTLPIIKTDETNEKWQKLSIMKVIIKGIHLHDLFSNFVHLRPSNIPNEFRFYNQTITVTRLPGASVNVTAVYSMWF